MHSSKKVIGTHNGIFHEDDVLAIALLNIYYDGEITVVRSREPKVLETCDVLVDIGGGKFDHHMAGNKKLTANNLPYASAGLVWKVFGFDILKKLGADEESIPTLLEDIDEDFVQPVDVKDNGILSDSPLSFVENFLPSWNSPSQNFDSCFFKVLDVVIKVTSAFITQQIATARARAEILNCIAHMSSSSNILFLPCQNIPWQQTIVDFNETTHSGGTIDFVAFPYPAGGYAAQSVPNKNSMFSKRIPFPELWAGESDRLPAICGIDDATFCHSGRFFIRANSKESIIMLCELATKIHKHLS